MISRKAETVEEKCSAALSYVRGFIQHKAPYVTHTLYGLVPYTAPGLETIAVTDTMVLLVDPEWFITLKLPVQAGTVMHEISHVVRDLKRIKEFADMDLANIAFDLPINRDLRDSKWELPEWVHYPELFKLPIGLTGEQYYDLLDQMKRDNDTLFKKILAKGQKVGSGKCGSITFNPVDKTLEQAAGRSAGRTPNDVARIKYITAHEIKEHNKKSRGTVPRNLLEWLPEEEERLVLVRWRDELHHVLNRATGTVQSGRTDYSYRRPSRRSFFYGIVKPGMIDRRPTVGFVEDTSASMGKAQLVEGRIQAADIFEQLGLTEAWWISADADVAAPPKILTLQQIRDLPVIGRGGTNFCPAIELATTLQPRPDILVYITDGDGAAPEFPPLNMEVVFCIVPSKYNRTPAEWATTIILEDRLIPA
jgi:predicted metal-dependent peptidase